MKLEVARRNESGGLLRAGVDVKYGFVAKHRGAWPLAMTGEALDGQLVPPKGTRKPKIIPLNAKKRARGAHLLGTRMNTGLLAVGAVSSDSSFPNIPPHQGIFQGNVRWPLVQL